MSITLDMFHQMKTRNLFPETVMMPVDGAKVTGRAVWQDVEYLLWETKRGMWKHPIIDPELAFTKQRGRRDAKLDCKYQPKVFRQALCDYRDSEVEWDSYWSAWGKATMRYRRKHKIPLSRSVDWPPELEEFPGRPEVRLGERQAQLRALVFQQEQVNHRLREWKQEMLS